MLLTHKGVKQVVEKQCCSCRFVYTIDFPASTDFAASIDLWIRFFTEITLDCELVRIAHQVYVLMHFFKEITLDVELLHTADWHYGINSDSHA